MDILFVLIVGCAILFFCFSKKISQVNKLKDAIFSNDTLRKETQVVYEIGMLDKLLSLFAEKMANADHTFKREQLGLSPEHFDNNGITLQAQLDLFIKSIRLLQKNGILAFTPSDYDSTGALKKEKKDQIESAFRLLFF